MLPLDFLFRYKIQQIPFSAQVRLSLISLFTDENLLADRGYGVGQTRVARLALPHTCYVTLSESLLLLECHRDNNTYPTKLP